MFNLDKMFAIKSQCYSTAICKIIIIITFFPPPWVQERDSAAPLAKPRKLSTVQCKYSTVRPVEVASAQVLSHMLMSIRNICRCTFQSPIHLFTQLTALLQMAFCHFIILITFYLKRQQTSWSLAPLEPKHFKSSVPLSFTAWAVTREL